MPEEALQRVPVAGNGDEEGFNTKIFRGMVKGDDLIFLMDPPADVTSLWHVDLLTMDATRVTEEGFFCQ